MFFVPPFKFVCHTVCTPLSFTLRGFVCLFRCVCLCVCFSLMFVFVSPLVPVCLTVSVLVYLTLKSCVYTFVFVFSLCVFCISPIAFVSECLFVPYVFEIVWW